MLPPELDYLFVADFADGTRYFQTPRDQSLVHPLTRSAFWDVSQRLSSVKKFTLVDRHYEHEHVVYLDDGHFRTDGKIISCPRTDLSGFELVYFRRVQQRQESDPYPRLDHVPCYIVGYFIGWTAVSVSGENFQMQLEIPPLGHLQRVVSTLIV